VSGQITIRSVCSRYGNLFNINMRVRLEYPRVSHPHRWFLVASMRLSRAVGLTGPSIEDSARRQKLGSSFSWSNISLTGTVGLIKLLVNNELERADR
jgi:hypothetical protein